MFPRQPLNGGAHLRARYSQSSCTDLARSSRCGLARRLGEGCFVLTRLRHTFTPISVDQGAQRLAAEALPLTARRRPGPRSLASRGCPRSDSTAAGRAAVPLGDDVEGVPPPRARCDELAFVQFAQRRAVFAPPNQAPTLSVHSGLMWLPIRGEITGHSSFRIRGTCLLR
jgi:hypothetical protein